MKKHFSLILIFVSAVALCALWTCSGFLGTAALAEPGVTSAGYTVDFSYQGQTYSVRGHSCCALDSILYRLGIEGDVTNARLDLAAGEDIEGALTLTRETGGWYLTSEVAFDSAYTLTAEVEGRTVTVRVTDASTEGKDTNWLKRFNRIPVTLVWEDNDNQDGARPVNVTLGLYKTGAETQKSSVSQIVLTGDKEENVWTGDFFAESEDENGNPIPYTVSVLRATGADGKEIKAADNVFNTGFKNNYQADFSDEQGLNVTVRYTPETIGYSFIKIWRDDGNRDGVRPESATVQLYADGEPCKEAVLRGGKTDLRWNYTFEDLPRYQNKKEITYTIRETGLDGLTWKDGTAAGWYQGNERVYTAWYERGSKLVEGQIQIVDQHDPEKVTVVAGKRWADSGNEDGVRPNSVTFTLYADGHTLPENDSHVAIVLDGETDTGLKAQDRGEKAAWRAYFTDLPRYRDGGVPIVYTVKETAMSTNGVRWTSADGGITWTSIFSRTPYISSGIADASNSYVITNFHQPGTITAALAVEWDDNDDEAAKRPAELEVRLLANGETAGTFTLNGETGWTAAKADLEQVVNEEKVEYTWQLPELQYYSETGGSRRTEKSKDGGTLTTTVTYHYEPDTVQPAVAVVWVDGDAPAGVRPASVAVRLLADDELKEEASLAFTEGDADVWSYSFGELPRRDEEGRKIAYTVEQDEVPGYKTEITGDAGQGFVITNTYYLANGSVRLSARKLVSGEEPAERDGTFSFELYIAEVDEANLKLLNAGEYPMAMVNNNGSSVLFPEISYDVSEAGRTYWFLVSEVVPEGGLDYEYDFTRFVAGVTLTDNGDGTLNTQTAWYRLDETTQVLTPAAEGAVFNNQRKDPDSLTVTMTVEGNRTSRHFDFNLVFKDENGLPLTGEYPYLIQDSDGKLIEEGSFNLDNGVITPKGTDGSVSFRLADGEMIIVNYLPVGSTYTVKEKNTKAYITSTQDNGLTNIVSGDIVEGGAHVDYINTEVTTDFKVTKKWEGGDPGWSISLTLGTVAEGFTGKGTISNGDFISLYPQPAYTREGNTYYFRNLPKYDEDDNIIVYAAKEAPIANYGLIRYKSANSNVSAYVLNEGTIINSKSTSFVVHKEWQGFKGEKLPDITLRLWRLNSEDNTLVQVEDKVCENKKQEEIVTYTFQVYPGSIYYVEEIVPKGSSYVVNYENDDKSTITGLAENGGKIINKKLPKTGDNDPVGLWTVMVMTGLLGLTVLAVLRIRRKQEG